MGFYFKNFGLLIKYTRPGIVEKLAENVNNNPTLADNSGEKLINEAEIKNIYSLIPIPPMEKTERIDEQIKTIIISTKLFSIPSDSITKKIVKNCNN